jgi:hypothetical protein
MNALAVLYGGNLREAAFEKVFAGKSGPENALTLALEKAAAFPGVTKTVLLVSADFDRLAVSAGFVKSEGVEIQGQRI